MTPEDFAVNFKNFLLERNEFSTIDSMFSNTIMYELVLFLYKQSPSITIQVPWSED